MTKSSHSTSTPQSTTRVDVAHVIDEVAADPVTPPKEVIAAVAGIDAARRSAQTDSQASQLATHLEHQEGALRHKEEQFHAHVAQLEQQLRTARLYLNDRQQELGDSESSLSCRQQELEQRAVLVSAAELAHEQDVLSYEEAQRQRELELERRERELITRTEQIDQREKHLERRSENDVAAVQQHYESVGQQGEVQHRELEEQREQLELHYQQRQEQLDQLAEKLREEISQQRGQLQQDRDEFFAQQREQRLSLEHLELEQRTSLQADTAATQQACEILKEDRQRFEHHVHQHEVAQRKAEKMLEETQEELTTREKEFAKNLTDYEAQIAKRSDTDQQQLVDKRLAHLDRMQQLLENGRRELSDAQAQQKKQQADWTVSERQQRRELAEQHRHDRLQLQKQQALLDQQQKRLTTREKSLEQIHGEVTQLHRETLEVRIVIEEVWGRLSKTANPAAITQSVAAARKKLTDQLQFQRQELTKQNEDVQRFTSRLAEQHLSLEQQKQQLQAWAQRRHEEVEQQAARLVKREQELDSQQTESDALRDRWNSERRKLREEIRVLSRCLGEINKEQATSHRPTTPSSAIVLGNSAAAAC